MRSAFDDGQLALKESARRFLTEQAGVTAARAAMVDGPDPVLWRRIAEELGWPALILPEAHGGFGMGHVELVALVEEMGMVLLCAPFFSTVCLAANAVMLCGSADQQARWLPDIAEGGTAALGIADGVTATPTDGGWRLSGRSARVIDGGTADRILVVATEPDGTRRVFAVSQPERIAWSTLDATRPMADLGIDETVSEEDRLPVAALSAVLDRARIALSAEQVGGAEACLSMAVEYAGVRRQFGRPIGSFQAIKHKCADMLVKVESARSACYHAGWAVDHAPDEVPLSAATAASYCGDAFFSCAGENIQIHGGIGFTWEHDAHLYFKRARVSRDLLGSPAAARERIAMAILG
ncbi:MAG: alkylation response protein AidB-like acyl-CoA dehydrogenase [Myxococcota bacterium]|jgi:alkylation response protein AidB-like acyl-CoA dehydrogenase